MFTPTFSQEWLQKKLDAGNDTFINAGGERTERLENTTFSIEILNEQDCIDIDAKKIKFICHKILSDAGFRTGRLGVVLTDNEAIHDLNLEYLNHDYPTDVMGFSLKCCDSLMEAELVVSAEMAKDRCKDFGWNDESELLLYVVHGVLHQVGYDDQTEYDAQLMQQKEAFYLRLLGIIVNPEDGQAEDETQNMRCMKADYLSVLDTINPEDNDSSINVTQRQRVSSSTVLCKPGTTSPYLSLVKSS